MSPTDVPSATAGDARAGRGGSLAQKINYLFETVRRPDGKSYSNEEVAEAITALGEATISGTYLWYLRRGDRDNPTKKHLEVLARFFNVSPAYFFDDDRTGAVRTVTARTDLVIEGRQAASEAVEADVRSVAALLHGLSPRSLRAMAELIGRVRELEGLTGTARHPGE